ncbi:thioredoxin [Laetiporus sulphureus 93-53]|uniref:Thioredoxin n=1 Tax=Laetiporus sulphureus 93-53 TaxID=1314785 RepID=A0A165BJ59_9APHY|nr:thioredoxin [Laetiporus sulphureus 93-53]KZT01157.1 thioredoxin [Laetiporus sulphureus 93-53]
MTVTVVNSLDQFHTIINSNRVSVVDFWAEWCGPCRFISPVFEKLSESEEYTAVDFYKVDVDAQEQISQEVGIRAMPTFIAFKNGQKLKDLVGANPGALEELIKAAVSDSTA